MFKKRFLVVMGLVMVTALFGLFPMADPEGVGMDVAPGVGFLGAEDLDLDIDFSPRGGLAGREIPPGPVLELEEDRGVVVELDSHLFGFAG